MESQERAWRGSLLGTCCAEAYEAASPRARSLVCGLGNLSLQCAFLS